MHMNSNWFRIIQRVAIVLAAVSLVLAGVLQEGQAEAAGGTDSQKECVQRNGLTFNEVGLWTRLPEVLKLYGQPERVEPMERITPNRVYARYHYNDIKLLIFNSIVWQVTVLTPDISSKSGIRLLSNFSDVQRRLAVGLKNPFSGPGSRDTYKVPICPPDPPEVDEYVIAGFDQRHRLVEFAVRGVFP